MVTRVPGQLGAIFRLVIVLLLLIIPFQSVTASPSPHQEHEGEAVFKMECAHCHSFWNGDMEGLDLIHLTVRRDQHWLESFISNPVGQIAIGDPVALDLVKEYKNQVMSDLSLTSEPVTAVISYIDAQAGIIGDTHASEVSQADSSDGNPENGLALFAQDVKLANGGPPCIGCHSIDDVGILGGGRLGPNLTNASGIYGTAGLVSVLKEIPFPTMKPVYARHPLTEGEQADLAAFIGSAAGQAETNKDALVLAVSLAGFLVALAVGAFYWRGRTHGVRRQLVERSRRAK